MLLVRQIQLTLFELWKDVQTCEMVNGLLDESPFGLWVALEQGRKDEKKGTLLIGSLMEGKFST